MTDKQPEALRLADRCEALFQIADAYDPEAYAQAAAELRRQHGEIKSMRAERLRKEQRLLELLAQREELLEALKEAADYLDCNSWVYRHAIAAIAKVKGEKK